MDADPFPRVCNFTRIFCRDGRLIGYEHRIPVRWFSLRLRLCQGSARRERTPPRPQKSFSRGQPVVSRLERRLLRRKKRPRPGDRPAQRGVVGTELGQIAPQLAFVAEPLRLRRRGKPRRYPTFSSFTNRPYATHSATKMLPSWSKAASCGQTNLPGLKLSLDFVRRVRTSVFVVQPSPRFATGL